jgi:hypothetical protein
MDRETRICQNCKTNFDIEPEDFNFYEKIKVPPPTFCAQCRMIRRMTWRNERSLFHRDCHKTGKSVIAMFHPEVKNIVYDRDIWWSDEWDPGDYGKNYDFSVPFFQQYKELLSRVPLANLGNNNVVNSQYGNHNLDLKDCYLTYASFDNERVSYSQGALHSKDSFDLYTVLNSENCYDNSICGDLYKTNFSFNSDESINSSFLHHCINLQDCIGCINLRNKSNCIFNDQYSKEEYKEKLKMLDLGSYTALSNFKDQFYDFTLNFPRKYANILKSYNCTGDNIGNSKNIENCFDVYGNVEDSKYLAHVVDMKDSYDLYGAGASSSLLYEGVDTGRFASKQLFAILTHSCIDTNYTYMCYNSRNLFGCIGIRKGEYCILNKKYSKEEYEELVPKIIKHMNEMPYVDSNGLIYNYGEFFPSELSPFAYNETIAQEYFPMSKENILNSGYIYREPVERDYKITINSGDLPDHIKEVSDEITADIISCANNGDQLTQCTNAYRITFDELSFLRHNNIALPRLCPNCRHYRRISLRNPMKLWHRSCMCDLPNHIHEGKCEVEFETSYAPERPEKVYCEKCYQAEVV